MEPLNLDGESQEQLPFDLNAVTAQICWKADRRERFAEARTRRQKARLVAIEAYMREKTRWHPPDECVRYHAYEFGLESVARKALCAIEQRGLREMDAALYRLRRDITTGGLCSVLAATLLAISILFIANDGGAIGAIGFACAAFLPGLVAFWFWRDHFEQVAELRRRIDSAPANDQPKGGCRDAT